MREMKPEEAWLSDYPRERYNRYSRYLRELYGHKVYRVSVDAGLTCPNRGPDRRRPGCTYCDERGSRAPYLARTAELREQVDGALRFLRARYAPQDFILYFQAFSGTAASVMVLKALYDGGLCCGNFRELIVSTRPDCVDREKAELLASYRERGLDVWVELGLQSAHDRTLQRINRGHSVACFADAYGILAEQGIKIAVHLILGLPRED